MAKTKEIKMLIPQGTTYIHTFNYTKSDGSLIDLTGYTARLQIRQNVTATTTLYNVTNSSGELVLGNGMVVLTMAEVDTAAFNFKNAVFDLEIISPANIVTRLVQGKVEVDPEVTR